jgi:hypothetical protein
MYKALKSAQNDIQEALLKFVDETSSVGQKLDTSRCPRGEPCQCALITQSVPKADDTHLKDIENTLQFLHQKQNAQYEVLVKGVQDLNISMANIVKILSEQTRVAIETATIIPNLAPSARSTDLKDVCVDVGFSHIGNLSDMPKTLDTPMGIDEDESAIEADDVTPDIEEEVPEEADSAEEEEDIEVEEEGIEVEEWSFKGRKFFKDTENTVYANNDGELGDPIGLYDPVKNIVKKLSTSS